MRRALALTAGFAALLAVPDVARAGTVDPGSKRVISGIATVSSCGSLAGTTVSWNVTAGSVTTVSLAAIPAACVGGTLALTLGGAAGTSLASVSAVTIGGTSQTLTLSASASSVLGAYLSVVGT